MKYLTAELAEYVFKISYECLSPRAIEVAKQIVLDSYGNIVYGRYSNNSKKIMKYFALADGKNKNENQVNLIGTEKLKTSLDTAVFTHTMMARCADLDDGYRHAMGHPGSGLVPLALSAGQLYNNNGREILTALVAAYDIYARLGEAVNPFMYRERGFDATGVCGAIAAAALICKLKGCTIDNINNAMGIAALFTGGTIEYQNDGTSGKIMCGGWGDLTGIRAMRLSEAGFTGPLAALEGNRGFFHAFKGNSGYCDTGNILKKLGKDFKIIDIYFKIHACMRGLHATLDGVLQIRNQYRLRLEDIESVDILTSSFVYRLSNPNPKTAVGAQASIQFATAIMLKYGKLDSENLILESFNDKDIKNTVKKITVIKDDEIQRYLDTHPTHFGASKIIIKTVSGKVYNVFKPIAMGDSEIPFGWDTLKMKFYNLVTDTPIEVKKGSYFDYIKNLDKHNDIHMLFTF